MATWTYSGNVYDASPPGATSFALTTEAGVAINYLQRSHIHVYKSVDGGATYTELSFSTDYTFNTEGTVIVLNVGIAAGEWIKLQRLTPYQTEYVEFQSSSQLTAGQLNTGERFSMYVDQELYDDITVQNKGFITDAPDDGNLYGRESQAWAQVPPPGISDAPDDSKEYVRYNSTWKEAAEIDTGVAKIVAGDNITISPTGGEGVVTVNAAATPYSLPIASESTLGGVRVGNNLVIDGDGVLSAVNSGGGGGSSKWTEDSGKLYPNNPTNNVQVGGSAADPNIELDSDGTITAGAASFTTSGRSPAESPLVINNTNVDGYSIYSQSNGVSTFSVGTDGSIRIGDTANTQAISLLSNGNATFAGEMQGGGRLRLNTDGVRSNTSSVLDIYDENGQGVGPSTIALYANGNASFAGGGSFGGGATFDGNLLVGTSTARTNIQYRGIAVDAFVQQEHSGNKYSGQSIISYSSADYDPMLTIGISASNTPGTNALVGPGWEIGKVQFVGNDGTAFQTAAVIDAYTDGTPAAGSMPGVLRFSTSAPGSIAPTERLTIDSAGTATFAGSATFAGGDIELSVDGSITAAGRATFDGAVTINNSLLIDSTAYSYISCVDGDNGAQAFIVYRGGDATLAGALSVQGGVSWFTSDVNVGGTAYAGGDSAVGIIASGSVFASNEANNNIWLGFTTGIVPFTSSIKGNGDATFKTVNGASVLIQLATEDESQYETTTETYTDTETYTVEVPVAPVLGDQVGTADEPETKTITKTREVEKTIEVKTYVGPVLDVKESIRSIQSALYRLKAAVLIPDSSVDELRLRILEALENISTTDVEV